MARLPYHEEAHAIWRLVGDLAQLSGGMRRIAQANKEAARILAGAVTGYADG